jgi:hypothetical protein
MDTLINRVLFARTASANLVAKSAETVMPDEADMVVCDQLGAQPYVVSSVKFHARPIPGLQGIFCHSVTYFAQRRLQSKRHSRNLSSSNWSFDAEPVTTPHFKAIERHY